MTWLRTNLVALLVGVAVLMAVGTVWGWTRAAHHKGVAEANAAESARKTHEIRALATSVTAARARVRVAEIRVDSAGARADAAEAETQRTRVESAATIAALNARIETLDTSSAERAVEAEAEAAANDGWVRIERYRADTDSLERRAKLSEAVASEERRAKLQERERGDRVAGERDALEVFVGELRAQVGALTEQVVVLEERDSIRVREIEALRSAAGGIFPDFGDFTKPVYAAVGGAIGYGLGQLTRSNH